MNLCHWPSIRRGLGWQLSLLALALGVTACEPRSEPPAVADDPAPEAALRPVERLELDGHSDLHTAAVPFGLLRVAPAQQEVRRGTIGQETMGQATIGQAMIGQATMGQGLSLSHARGEGALDLVLGARVGNLPEGRDTGEPRWSSNPGRLVGARPETGLLVEVSASERVALYRFTVFPGTPLDLSLDWIEGSAAVLETARGRRAVTGNSQQETGAELHAALRFDHDFTRLANPDGAGGLRLRFEPADGVVRLRLALSTVDLAGARANLQELPGWNLEAAIDAASKRWDAWLARLELPADDPLSRSLAVDWYRVLAHYGTVTDLDGRFRAADGAVRRAPGDAPMIGNLDLAKEAETVIPLLGLLAPDVAASLVEGLLLHQRVADRFPEQTRWGFETGSGPSPNALPVLAGLVSRSLPGVDAERVLPPMLKEAATVARERAERGGARTGFFAFDRYAGPSVSATLEMSHGDHAVAVVAALLGNRTVATEYATRSLFYRMLFDSETGFFRGRDSDRDWRTPFRPPDLAGPAAADYAEGSPWPAFWYPSRFDIDGWLGLVGGRQQLAARLDEFFAGAVPSEVHRGHEPWLFAFSNDPSRMAPLLAETLVVTGERERASTSQSAGRLFTGLGFYPVLNDSAEYVLGVPQVPAARLRLAGGELLINGPGRVSAQLPDEVLGQRSDQEPGQAAGQARRTLDGVTLVGPTITHRRLVAGGTLLVEVP